MEVQAAREWLLIGRERERERIKKILWDIAERMRNDNPHGCHAMMVALAEIEPDDEEQR